MARWARRWFGFSCYGLGIAIYAHMTPDVWHDHGWYPTLMILVGAGFMARAPAELEREAEDPR